MEFTSGNRKPQGDQSSQVAVFAANLVLVASKHPGCTRLVVYQLVNILLIMVNIWLLYMVNDG